MRYVAIGDSFTEGVGDERPDGSLRGWADLVAAGLAAGRSEPVQYANLAVRGRLLRPIVTDQLDRALAMAPTMITLNGGGNDMMRPRTDLARLVDLTRRAVERCVDAGVQLVLLSGADPSARMPFGRLVRRRGEVLTAAIAGLAREHGLVFVDMFSDDEIRRPGYWTVDRIHLGPAGHRRVAAAVLAALGHQGEAHILEDEPAARRRLREEAAYYREHVLPWVHRRLRGRSSGDAREPKYSDYVPIPAS